MSDDEALANLGNAVVKVAVTDYRWSRWYLSRFNSKSKRYQEALATKEECERFFNSEYFNIFSMLDGKILLQNLNRESCEHRTYLKF